MEIYWQQTRRGQQLILSSDNGETEEIGAVRETKRGFDALAKTFGYDPGRAQKGIPTLQEAKAFVESFRPWELYANTQDITVDADIRSAST